MAKSKASLPLNQQAAMTSSDRPAEERGMARIMGKQAVSWVERVSNDIDARAHLSRLFKQVHQNPTLAKCDPSSIIGCAIEAAILGLSFSDVLGQAYAVPYYDSKTRTWQAQFQVGYRGYITKMVDNVTTYAVGADVFHRNDTFDYDTGESWVKHKPALEDRGDVVGAWAKAVHNNGVQTVVVVTKDQILQARDSSSSYKNAAKGGYAEKTPWGKYFSAMAMKTAIHRLSKLIPVSSGLEALVVADGSVFTGMRDDGDTESFNPELQFDAQAEEVTD